MCDLNGPFKLCSCADEIDLSKPHWKLYRNVIEKGEPTFIMGTPNSPDFNFILDIIQQKKMLRRMNTLNVFDFEYAPNEGDKLFIYENEVEYIELEFKGGKWKKINFFGIHSNNKHEYKLLGIIEGETSRLKDVYSKYLSGLNKNEENILKGLIYLQKQN